MNNGHSFRGSFVCVAFLHVEILPGHCDRFPTTRVLVHGLPSHVPLSVCLSLSSRSAASERSDSRFEEQTNTADIAITFSYIR